MNRIIIRDRKVLMLVLFMTGQVVIMMSAYVANIVLAADPLAGKLVMGTASIVILIMFYAAPMSQLMQVVQSRNAASFAWPLLLACMINALLWTGYGYYGLASPDPFVWCPNAVGVLVSVIQCACKLYYPSLVNKSTAAATPDVYLNLNAQPDVIVDIPPTQAVVAERHSH